MASHLIAHPVRGICNIDVGRYATFSLRFSKETAKVPETHLKANWPKVEAALVADGARITQLAWVTEFILVQKKGKVWHVTCEATFGQTKVTHAARGKDSDAAQKEFWSTWNASRRAANQPTHLAILEDKRYRFAIPLA